MRGGGSGNSVGTLTNMLGSLFTEALPVWVSGEQLLKLQPLKL